MMRVSFFNDGVNGNSKVHSKVIVSSKVLYVVWIVVSWCVFLELKLKLSSSILCCRFDILNLTPLFQEFGFDDPASVLVLLESSSAVASDIALFFVPCLQHTPPLTTWLVRSSWLHGSTFFSCYNMMCTIRTCIEYNTEAWACCYNRASSSCSTPLPSVSALLEERCIVEK